MEKKGLQNEELLSDIKQRGRGALTPKNDYGLVVVNRDDTRSGIIHGFLDTPKYNEIELRKSINIDIEELLPENFETLSETVSRDVYQEALNTIDEFENRITELENEKNQLNTTIQSLEIQIETKDSQIESLNEQIQNLQTIIQS